MFRSMIHTLFAVAVGALAVAAAPVASAAPASQSAGVKAAAESVSPATEVRHRRGHLRRSSGWHSRRGSYHRGTRYRYYPRPYYYSYGPYPRPYYYYPRAYIRPWGGPAYFGW